MDKKFKLPQIVDHFFEFGPWCIADRIHLHLHGLWSSQCRKADLHLAVYPKPLRTVSFGFTIPLLLCVYINFGMKPSWWDKRIGPNFKHATFGLWVFVGTRLASISYKTRYRYALKTVRWGDVLATGIRSSKSVLNCVVRRLHRRVKQGSP